MSLHDDGLTRAYRFAQSCALTEHSRGRGDEERQWLDVLALLDLACHPEPDVSEPAWPVTDHEFVGVAGHPDDDECTYRNDGTDLTYCGEPKDAHQLQVQAPVGEGLENGASDGEREALLELLMSPQHGTDECHDPRDGVCLSCPWPLHAMPPEDIRNALLGAGYRKAPVVLPKVEDVERVIYECIVQGGGNEEHFAFVKGGIFRHAARHVLALFNPKEES